MKNPSTQSIPKEVALEICSEIAKENEGKWYSWAAWRCRGCVKWSRGDEDMLYFNCQRGLRGCSQVNSRYAKMITRTS